METIDYERKWKRLMQALKEYEPDVTPEEKIIDLEQQGIVFFTPRVIERMVEVEKPPKSTPEQLEYAKWYRQHQKEVNEMKKKEDFEAYKIEEILNKPRRFTCFNCMKAFDVEKPLRHEVKEKRNGKRVINVFAKCPICQNEAKNYGGLLPKNDKVRFF